MCENKNMLTAKSNYSYYTQTTQFGLLSVKPRLLTLPELIHFSCVLDVLFEFCEGCTSVKTPAVSLRFKYFLPISYSSDAVLTVHLEDSCWVFLCFCSQGRSGSSVFLWREWCLQTGDLQGGDLLENSPKEVTEGVGLCSMPFPWMWPLFWQLLGNHALWQPYHHHRQVCLIRFGQCDVVQIRVIF